MKALGQRTKPTKMSVLIVSSDASDAKNTGKLIECKILGAKAIYAKNLNAALGAAKLHSPHLVVTEMHSGSPFSGLELAKKLAKSKSRVVGFAHDNFYVHQPKAAFEKAGALFVDRNKQGHLEKLVEIAQSFAYKRGAETKKQKKA